METPLCKQKKDVSQQSIGYADCLCIVTLAGVVTFTINRVLYVAKYDLTGAIHTAIDLSHSYGYQSTLESQQENATGDHRDTRPFAQRWSLSQERESEYGDENEAELVNRRHLGCISYLECPEVTYP